MSIIGRSYLVDDNSWSCKLVNDKFEEYHPLGDGLFGKEVLVLSNPYNVMVEMLDEPYTTQFINVSYLGEIYRVVYHKSQIGKSNDWLSLDLYSLSVEELTELLKNVSQVLYDKAHEHSR